MNKENGSINIMEQEDARLVRRYGRRARVLYNIGRGQVQAGFPLEKTYKKDGVRETRLVSAYDNTLKVGRVRENVYRSMNKILTVLWEKYPEVAEARRYDYDLKGEQIKLTKTSAMYVNGDVAEDTLLIGLVKFREFASQAEDPLRKRGLERLKQIREAEQRDRKIRLREGGLLTQIKKREQIEREKVQTITSETETVFTAIGQNGHQLEKQPVTETVTLSSEVTNADAQHRKRGSKDQYELPDREIATGGVARLFKFFDETSDENQFTTTYVLTTHYRELNKTKARTKFGIELALARKLGRPSGTDIINTVPVRKGVEGRYYLKRPIQPATGQAIEVTAEEADLTFVQEPPAHRASTEVVPAEPLTSRPVEAPAPTQSSAEAVQELIRSGVLRIIKHPAEVRASDTPAEASQVQTLKQEPSSQSLPALTRIERNCLQALEAAKDNYKLAASYTGFSVKEFTKLVGIAKGKMPNNS